MKTKNDSNGSKAPKKMTRKRLAQMYGVAPKTLNNRIKRENLDISPRSLFPDSVTKIFKALGVLKELSE